MNCSNLKGHLFNLKIIKDNNCACGHIPEDSYHYFFTCPLYQQQRVTLLNSVYNFTAATLKTLLFGNPDIPYEDNIEVLRSVFTYIEDSGRF